MNVRIRGIYTTALTELLGEGGDHDVVQASPPIRERFNETFPIEVADATVRTADDRQGVGVAGDPDAVGRVRERLAGIGRDALAWPNPAPRGAVFRGVVAETLGSGAVVDLGTVEGRSVSGFLPYDRVEGYVEEGDIYRLQVAVPAPPWSGDRPSLATALRVPGGLVELRRDGGDPRGETARMADLLPVDPPEGWAPRWSRAAEDADLEAMAAVLERASDRAEAMMSAIAAADGDDPGRIVAPQAGAWVWFGRESRFELDAVRERVTPTMAGHHRVKAGDDDASTAVDFLEAVCGDGSAVGTDGEFPFEAVAGAFGPREGDRVAIDHGKPEGRTIVLGRGEVTELEADGTVTVERAMTGGGTYDALGVERREGDVATTTFVEGRWWYPTVYRGANGDHRGTYVNVCTPVEVFPDCARYVDLHVDVVKTPDGEVRRVDDDDLDAAVEAGDVPDPLAERAREVASSIENAL
ncbi:RNA-binding protein [Halobacteriales archaeon QS_9_68_42]|nr:MAG: RNA-binding protein [Halobacteriales archaeon QS_9_68_42]